MGTTVLRLSALTPTQRDDLIMLRYDHFRAMGKGLEDAGRMAYDWSLYTRHDDLYTR